MFSGSGAKKLSLNNFNTSKGTAFSYMFSDGTLEELDIESFDTRKGIYMRSMFYAPTNTAYSKLKRVTLGPNFRFKGNDIQDSRNWAILPTPPTTYTTGKWVREDDPDMVFTPEELRDAYDQDPSYMAGTWIWEMRQDVCLVHFDANGGYYMYRGGTYKINQRSYTFDDNGVCKNK